jgi:hypothetical protein
MSVRKQGPRKGDGGRPALTLDQDPDRKIIIASLWFWRTRDKQRSIPILQLLDFLFSEHDVIAVATEPGKLTLENTTPNRATCANAPPEHRPLSAPGGRAFRRSRLRRLQQKIDDYRDKEMTGAELAYCSQAELALAMLATGNPMAQFTFATVGWEISEAEGKRLALILSAKPEAA